MRREKNVRKKRILAAVLAAGMLLSYTGCGKLTDRQENKKTETCPVEIVDDNYRNYYEIFVRSYYDSDGNKIGDLDGVREKLDYICELGFNGIWLMPIMPSTTYHKYDVTDYMDISPEYGTMEDFDELIQACHEKKIRVVIDLVMNHTSSKHPWFQEACRYLQALGSAEPSEETCPYFGYYHFSREEQSGYYRVPGTDWFYEGSFWQEMPDLDLGNEKVIAEFDAIADFWIDHGVDGFRMDAAMHFDEENAKQNYETLNHLYTHCKEQNPDFYMVSEVWASESVIASYYESETPSMFNFPVSGAEGLLVKAARGKCKAKKYVEQLKEYEDTYGEAYGDYIDAPFLTNHDQVRIANNLMSDEENLKMAAGLLLTMDGSPFVYYGEEVGMKSAGQEDENKRLPMHWSDSDGTGMTNAPQGADPNVQQTFAAVDLQEQDADSLLSYYKRALEIRNRNPEIARGKITIVESEAVTNDNTAGILKEWNESKVGILYNLSEAEQTVDLSGTEMEGFSIADILTLEETEVNMQGTTVIMPPKSIIIVK